MPDFNKLYDYCQTLQPRVKRNVIIKKAQELSGKQVKIIKSSLDIEEMRGIFISANNKESGYVRQMGCNVIVIARGMNECWDRFVTIKEAMHLFDSENGQTDTGEEFVGLLSELATQKPSSQSSKQFDSEIKSVWMALGCLCPEQLRLEFIDQLEKGHIDHYGIALKLKIPERQVRNLVSDKFKSTIEKILEDE